MEHIELPIGKVGSDIDLYREPAGARGYIRQNKKNVPPYMIVTGPDKNAGKDVYCLIGHQKVRPTDYDAGEGQIRIVNYGEITINNPVITNKGNDEYVIQIDENLFKEAQNRIL